VAAEPEGGYVDEDEYEDDEYEDDDEEAVAGEVILTKRMPR
jgi:hypothetical protein